MVSPTMYTWAKASISGLAPKEKRRATALTNNPTKITKNMQAISVEDLKTRLDAGESLHLLDVREPAEHDEFNIGGTLLPLGRIRNLETDDIDNWKEQEVICYCRSGNRSAQACMILESAGFANVKNLTGGMMTWQDRFGG
jgi:rhodanese-related sulfurtransferase